MPNQLKHNSVYASVLFISIVLFTCPAWSQRVERTIQSWRPVHYSVNIAFNEQFSEIKASTEIDVEILKPSVDRIDIQFGELAVDSVMLQAKPARFQRQPGVLSISLPQAENKGTRLKVLVSYHGRPKDGLVLTKDKDGFPSATGDNWPDRVHNWIPSLDHPSAKAPVTFTVTAPERDYAIANGRLVSRTSNPDKTVTWVYDESAPIPPYCMVIAVDQFVISGPASRPWLTFAVPPSDRALAAEFAPAEQILDFFSAKIAEYPYKKLALIIGATQFGGMENSGAIVFPSNFLHRANGELLTSAFHIPLHVEETTAHEIAHQWFGDSITESTWADLWLSEGFATYLSGLFTEKYEGKVPFDEYMKRQANGYFAYEKQNLTPIHDTQTKDLFKLLNPNNYNKGAWVLHMLRGLVGDDLFFAGLRDYYRAHLGGNADTEGLRKAMEKASGRDLKSFFDRWVYGSGHPVFEVALAVSQQTDVNVVDVRIIQRQNTPPFLITVPILVKTTAGETRKDVVLTGEKTIVSIPLTAPGRPLSVALDPDNIVLKEIVER
jgi:aminopeptidase N